MSGLDLLALAADPVLTLIAIGCLLVAAVATFLLACEQHHRRAAEDLAEAAQAARAAAEAHIEQLQEGRRLDAHLTGLRTQLVLTLGASQRMPTGPRTN